MNDLWFVGTVDRKVEKDTSNPKWPKYMLVVSQDVTTAKGESKRQYAQIDVGFPDAIKAKALSLKTGERVMVKGYVKSQPAKEGDRFFTGLYAREILQLDKPADLSNGRASEAASEDFNVPF